MYVIDAQVRGSVLELIHFAEVGLRAHFHIALTQPYGPDWFRGRTVILDDRTREHFQEAEKRITHAQPNPDRIIAEVSLGAWGELLEVGGTSTGGRGSLAGRADYETTLWNSGLDALFGALSLTRQPAAALVRRVRRIRNRVAHHESVIFGIHQPGERDSNQNHLRQRPASALGDVRTLLALFCVPAAAWLASCTHADELLAEPLAATGLTRIEQLLPSTTWR